jgi:selenide,water dikinase
VLDALPRSSPEFARLLETHDDAAVTRLSDDLCLVQTVDFFTPIVDSPYWFGQLAAANALSDVYAMGARPLTAMNLVAWPADLGMTHLAEILQGGAEKVMEAGADLAGGHSIDDKEPKYGLAVTGVAHPDEIVYNAGARPGDKLVLTKRLGIGVLASALKKGLLSEEEMMPAIEEAAALNAAAAAAMSAVGAHACTDVSGFGLLGHLGEMLAASAVGAVVRVADVPLHDGVLGLIAQAVYAGGLRSNRDFLLPRLRGAGGGAEDADQQEPRVLALFDPQTSGGLLIAVAADRHAALLSGLGKRGVTAWTVGEVTAGPPGIIALDG